MEQRNYTNLVDSVAEVVSEIFSKTTKTTNIISSSKVDNCSVKDFYDQILSKNVTYPFVYRQESLKVSSLPGRWKRCVVLVAQNFQEFMNIFLKITPQTFNFRGQYLIVLINGEIPEIRQMFELLWKIQIYNANVVYEDKNGNVLVKTFKPFNVADCNSTTPFLINQFINRKFLQNVKNFFPDKFKNLHNCSIRISISNSS